METIRGPLCSHREHSQINTILLMQDVEGVGFGSWSWSWFVVLVPSSVLEAYPPQRFLAPILRVLCNSISIPATHLLEAPRSGSISQARPQADSIILLARQLQIGSEHIGSLQGKTFQHWEALICKDFGFLRSESVLGGVGECMFLSLQITWIVVCRRRTFTCLLQLHS